MLNFTDYNVPEHTQQALTDYIERGIPVGGFLHSLLCNDLFGAVGRADSSNLAALKDIVMWVYNCAPHGCCGSEALYLRWIQEHPTRTRGPKDLA
jgi:hypothetical protein